MSADLRTRLSLTVATGSIEELGTLLFLVYLISLHPKTRKTGPNFRDQAGSASQDANKINVCWTLTVSAAFGNGIGSLAVCSTNPSSVGSSHKGKGRSVAGTKKSQLLWSEID